MPILSAFILPNLTLLAPGVGGDNLSVYRQTVAAYQAVADKIQKADIETVVIISNRGPAPEIGLAINIHHQPHINFEEFGDLTTKLTVAGDWEMIDWLKNNSAHDLPITLTTVNPLDYGSAVPLTYLLPIKPNLKIVTIYPSGQSLFKQFEHGAGLAKIINNFYKRTAVIAANNFSSRLSDSPLGYLPKAKGYDKKIIAGLDCNDHKFLLNLSAEDLSTYYEQGLAPITMLAGLLADTDKTIKTASYEYPQGLAVAVINFNF